MNENDEEVTEEVTKTFEMKNVKEITPTELIPSMLGALQFLIDKVETLENEIKVLKEK